MTVCDRPRLQSGWTLTTKSGETKTSQPEQTQTNQLVEMGTTVVHHFFITARMEPNTKGGRMSGAGSDPHTWVSLKAPAYLA